MLFGALTCRVICHEVSSPSLFFATCNMSWTVLPFTFFSVWRLIFFMATILQLRVTKRRLLEKVSLERWSMLFLCTVKLLNFLNITQIPLAGVCTLQSILQKKIQVLAKMLIHYEAPKQINFQFVLIFNRNASHNVFLLFHSPDFASFTRPAKYIFSNWLSEHYLLWYHFRSLEHVWLKIIQLRSIHNPEW